MDAIKISMTPEYFGRLWEYVNDKNITDIDFNGKMLWLRITVFRNALWNSLRRE